MAPFSPSATNPENAYYPPREPSTFTKNVSAIKRSVNAGIGIVINVIVTPIVVIVYGVPVMIVCGLIGWNPIYGGWQ